MTESKYKGTPESDENAKFAKLLTTPTEEEIREGLKRYADGERRYRKLYRASDEEIISELRGYAFPTTEFIRGGDHVISCDGAICVVLKFDVDEWPSLYIIEPSLMKYEQYLFLRDKTWCSPEVFKEIINMLHILNKENYVKNEI